MAAAVARLAAAERYARMRREARDAIDDDRPLYGQTEVAACPNLRWLSVSARCEALQLRAPLALPPLASPRRAPLQALDESSACPICLDALPQDFTEAAADEAVRWIMCCGRAFHAACIARCGRVRRSCPTCRAPFNLQAKDSLISPPRLLRTALQLEPLPGAPCPSARQLDLVVPSCPPRLRLHQSPCDS